MHGLTDASMPSKAPPFDTNESLVGIYKKNLEFDSYCHGINLRVWLLTKGAKFGRC